MSLVLFTKSLSDHDVPQLIERGRALGVDGYDLCVRAGHPVQPSVTCRRRAWRCRWSPVPSTCCGPTIPPLTRSWPPWTPPMSIHCEYQDPHGGHAAGSRILPLPVRHARVRVAVRQRPRPGAWANRSRSYAGKFTISSRPGYRSDMVPGSRDSRSSVRAISGSRPAPACVCGSAVHGESRLALDWSRDCHHSQRRCRDGSHM